MGHNKKPKSTVTRTVSLRMDVAEKLEQAWKAERTDRSSFVNDVLEDILGIKTHPEIRAAVRRLDQQEKGGAGES